MNNLGLKAFLFSLYVLIRNLCQPEFFFDDWLATVWGKKLGIYVTYCRMIKKGMFVVFLKNHKMQESILEKKFWNVGRSIFRAYPWSPKCNIEKMVARAPPNWVEIKNLNVEF